MTTKLHIYAQPIHYSICYFVFGIYTNAFVCEGQPEILYTIYMSVKFEVVKYNKQTNLKKSVFHGNLENS
jgi:hypothetical protein